MEKIKRILTQLIRLRKKRLAARDLRSMPDYLLRDIGITRDQIDAYVRDGLAPREVRCAPPAGAMRSPAARLGAGARCCAA